MSNTIQVEIIPGIFKMPMYVVEENMFVPRSFLMNLGVQRKDIEDILGVEENQIAGIYKIKTCGEEF